MLLHSLLVLDRILDSDHNKKKLLKLNPWVCIRLYENNETLRSTKANLISDNTYFHEFKWERPSNTLEHFFILPNTPMTSSFPQISLVRINSRPIIYAICAAVWLIHPHFHNCMCWHLGTYSLHSYTFSLFQSRAIKGDNENNGDLRKLKEKLRRYLDRHFP